MADTKEKIKIDDIRMNKIQKHACKLMYNDLRFLYTIFKNHDITKYSYYIGLLPYMGLIIDGVEDWINAYNNSSKEYELELPVFTKKEKLFYEQMRNSIKLFENGFDELNRELKEKYQESEEYFSSICKPLARELHLYDVYGVYTCNDIACDNTILDQYYFPFFNFNSYNKEEIVELAKIGGKYISCFSVLETYKIDYTLAFDTKDFGGFIKSPFGEKYNEKFLLFSILCQINFIIFAVDKLIIEECSTKLRFAYILYYYLLQVLPDINKKLGLSLTLDDKYFSEEFRNTMAHYKLGVSLKEFQLLEDDYMFGLSQKILCTNSKTLKDFVYNELESLSNQLKNLLYN